MSYFVIEDFQQDTDAPNLLQVALDAFLYGALVEAAPFLQDDARLPVWESKVPNRDGDLEGSSDDADLGDVTAIRSTVMSGGGFFGGSNTQIRSRASQRRDRPVRQQPRVILRAPVSDLSAKRTRTSTEPRQPSSRQRMQKPERRRQRPLRQRSAARRHRPLLRPHWRAHRQSLRQSQMISIILG